MSGYFSHKNTKIDLQSSVQIAKYEKIGYENTIYDDQFIESSGLIDMQAWLDPSLIDPIIPSHIYLPLASASGTWQLGTLVGKYTA